LQSLADAADSRFGRYRRGGRYYTREFALEAGRWAAAGEKEQGQSCKGALGREDSELLKKAAICVVLMVALPFMTIA